LAPQSAADLRPFWSPFRMATAPPARRMTPGVLRPAGAIRKVWVRLPSHATDLDPAETRLCAAAPGGRCHPALRAKRAAPGRPEAGPRRPRPGGEALRRPQGQALLRLAVAVPDVRADRGHGVGRPGSGGRGPYADGADRRHQGPAGDRPRRLRPQRPEQPGPR